MKKVETNPRAAALTSLVKWEKDGRYANLEVNAALGLSALSGADRGLYTALFYGVVERVITLDYMISRLSSRPADTIDRETMCALRLGLYQLTYMDRIPPHAAVSESVAVSPARSRGFVNALLRQHLRNGCSCKMPDDPLARLSVEYSAPPELCQFWIRCYGEETARQLLRSTTRNPAVTLRVNESVTTAEDVLRRHEADGAQICPLSPDMVALSDASGIADGIRQGLYFVQDPASRLCIRALDPRPGETVIDTCAAPGGKTFSCAMDMKNRGRVLAFDLHENKLSLIRRTAECLGISIIETAQRDGRQPDPTLFETADRVLCDAPCSGLGVIAKKPDIKYKPLEAAEGLPSIQYEILSGASRYVKPGGVLLYSTCTLNPAENEEIVRRFLDSHSEFSPADFDLGPAGTSRDGMRTFMPHLNGCDGFFIAKMLRR